MVAAIDVDGLRDVQRKLEALPGRVRRKVVRGATNKASTPVLKDGRKDAPKGDGLRPDGSKRKHLKRLLIKRQKSYSRDGVFTVFMGARWPEGAHGHLVEAGTKPHLITGKLLVSRRGTIFGRQVQHPGARGRHFLRKSLFRNQAKVFRILSYELNLGIQREAAKL